MSTNQKDDSFDDDFAQIDSDDEFPEPETEDLNKKIIYNSVFIQESGFNSNYSLPYNNI